MIVATLGQLSAHQAWELFKLRVDVFVVEQQCPYEEIDMIDAEATHVLAYESERLVGCARVYAEQGEWHLGRLCVAPEHRGTGLAGKIMQTAMAQCQGDIVLSAQSPLVRWYQAFGFEVSGPEFDWDGIAHTPMRRKAVEVSSPTNS